MWCVRHLESFRSRSINLYGTSQFTTSWSEGAGIVVSDGEILKGERGLGLLTEAIKGDQMDQQRWTQRHWPCSLCHIR